MSNLQLLKKSFFVLGMILLTAIPFASAEESLREIKITAAVSAGFQKNPDWQKEIRDRVMFVNQIFEKKFRIHFSVYRFVNWNPEDEKRETYLLIQELHSAFQIGPDEVVVGFHKMSQPFGKEAVEDLETVGTAEFFQGFVILRDPYQELTALQRQVTMAHEMTHLFGGIHISGQNQIMNASMAAEPAMSLDPDNEAIIQITKRIDFLRGSASLSNPDIDQLIEVYEKLIRKNPHSDFYYQLGHFYQLRGLPARAVSVWEEAVRYEYSNPLIHWELGRYYYQNSRFDAAIKELGSAIAFFILPSQKAARATAYNFLGVSYYRKGNLEQAIFSWLKGLSSDPDNLELQGNLAAAYMENGDLDRAITELTKLAAKYPDDETTLSNLGVAYLKKKDYEKAAQYELAALEKLGYSNEKKIYREEKEKITGKKQTQEEDTAADRLMSEIPETLLHLNLGAAYYGMGDMDKALPELEKAQKLDPKNYEVIENLTYAYLRKKQYEKVIDFAKQALEMQKGNANLYSSLAEAYAMSGKEKEALEAAKTGLLYASPSLRATLRKNMAVLYARSGAAQEALTELKNSLNDNWNDGDTHVKLGYMYAQMNRFEEAKRSFETALRVDPNQAEAKKALETIFPKK